MMKPKLALLGIVSACVIGAPLAQAQEGYPQRAVNLIVPYVPGGPVDIIGRLVSTKLANKWGKPVVVDNRGGAGGNIGSEWVARASADGYSLLINTPALVINPSFLDKTAVDPQRDLTAITKIGFVPAVLMTGAKSRFNTARELLAYGRANPGKLNFGSPGTGTSLHLAGEMFRQLGGFEATHVPYKGTSQAANDVIAGQIDFTFDAMVAALPQVRGGTVKALAVTSTERVPQLPQVPTLQESGVPGYEFTLWYGIFGPAKLPKPVSEKIGHDIAEVLRDPDVKSQLESTGFIIVGNSPAEFTKEIVSEARRWSAISAKMTTPAK